MREFWATYKDTTVSLLASSPLDARASAVKLFEIIRKGEEPPVNEEFIVVRIPTTTIQEGTKANEYQHQPTEAVCPEGQHD